MSIQELHQTDWFYRVYERLGILKDSIPSEVLENFDAFKNLLSKLDVSVQECEKIIAWETDRQIERENKKRFFSEENLFKTRPLARYWHFGFTVNLNRYSHDLTRFDSTSYSQFPFFGHKNEMNSIEMTLKRSDRNNVIIAGTPGSGRRMLVHEFARRIRSGEYDHTDFMNMRILECDFSEAASLAKESGSDQENFIHNIFHEAAYAGNIILLIRNLEKYMDGKSFSLAELINKYSPLPTIRVIGITTRHAFEEKISVNKPLMRNFEVVHVNEMSEDETMQVLFNYFYGTSHTPFTFQSLRRILADSERYINYSPLPLRAIDLATEVLDFWKDNNPTDFISTETVDAFVREKTGIPLGSVTETEKNNLLSLEEKLRERVIGQDIAVDSISKAVRRMRSGINDPRKPAGSFLFLGPTGVGKTQTAKALSEAYFGDKNKVIRLDMSEFKGSSALDRLIGSKELGQQGILTKSAKEHPYALLLLDEIEKANPKTLDIFLQILDEGFVHDAFGEKINFGSMIIIATSNAGSLEIKKLVSSGTDLKKSKKEIIDLITEKDIFHIEFLNRFDDIILFQPLKKSNLPRIVKILLEEFSELFEEEKNIEVRFEEGIEEEIIKSGFNPEFGARSIIHYIKNTIADALAKKLISGNIKSGEKIIFAKDDMEV